MISQRIPHALALIALFVSVGTVSFLALRVIPLGEGPDELSHIDHAFFRFARPSENIDVDAGLYYPNRSPLGQAHQPPLSYFLWAQVLSLILERDEVGAFIDYQAGIRYSSDGIIFGGSSTCAYTHDQTQTASATEVAKFRSAMWLLRLSNGALFVLSLVSIYLMGVLLFPTRPWIVLALVLFQAGVPNVLWRSVFVNNDNVVATICSMVFALGVYLILRPKRGTMIVFLMSLLSAAAFLAKYNGIAALGMTMLAIALRPSIRLRWKVGHVVLAAAIFIALVQRDLFYNYQVDGDLFSTAVVAHLAPYLYRPSSFFAILTDPQFVPQMVYRFWVEYHNPGKLDPRFPYPLTYTWPAMLIVSGIGLVLGGHRGGRSKFSLPIRVIVFSLLSIVGSILVIVYYGTTFPLPGGRYLHLALGPFSVVVVLGILVILEICLSRRQLADRALACLFMLHFLVGVSVTVWYLKGRYEGCLTFSSYTVAAGAEVTAADIDGDEIDELIFFHRIRNRTFFAKRIGSEYQIIGDWTRSIGLVADVVLGADLTGDNRAELIFFRPSSGTWFVVDGREIIRHNEQLSPYSDLAAKPVPLRVFGERGDVPFLADMNHDGLSEPIVYRSTIGWLGSMNNAHEENFDTKQFELTKWGDALSQQTQDNLELFIGKTNQSLFLGTLDRETSNVTLVAPAHYAKPTSIFLPTQGKRILPFDVNGDGFDDLLSWNVGDSCAQIILLNEQSFGTIIPKISGEFCFNSSLDGDRFQENEKAFIIRDRQNGPAIGLFDYRTGFVRIVRITDRGASDKTIKNRFTAVWSTVDPTFCGTGCETFRKDK